MTCVNVYTAKPRDKDNKYLLNNFICITFVFNITCVFNFKTHKVLRNVLNLNMSLKTCVFGVLTIHVGL